jgi:hypothetical protein
MANTKLRVFWDITPCKEVKQSHDKPMEAKGERKYSFYSFTTSALEGGERSASRTG